MPDTRPEPPRNVVLFSGHMIDAPGRATARFPADKESIAARAIADTLADLGVGSSGLAICGGACGGDLLFAEAALARGLRLELYIPFEQPTFLEKSVEFANRNWLDRFIVAKAAAVLHVAPSELGPLQEGEDAYERNNLWMLKSSLRFGAGRVDFVCLWDGKSGDNRGGTGHMMDEVAKRGGRIRLLDTTRLWN